MYFVRGRFLLFLSFNVILIEHLEGTDFVGGQESSNEKSSLLESLVLLEFPRLRHDSVHFVEYRTAGCPWRSNLHTIEKQRTLIEQSNFHDSLHGVDIERTTASRVGRILQVFFGCRHSGGSHIVPNSFHLKSNHLSYIFIS